MAKKMNQRIKRVTRVPRDPKSLAGFQIYRLRRSYEAGQVAIAATDSGGARYFQVAALPDWTDFSNLYDMYRVSKITWKYVAYRCAQPATTGEVFPTYLYALDFNDTTAPATASEVLSYGNAQIRQFTEGSGRVIEVTYQPKLNASTPAATAVLTENSWARTSSTSDVWYGHKEWFSRYNSTSFNNTVIQLYVTVDLEFKVAK